MAGLSRAWVKGLRPLNPLSLRDIPLLGGMPEPATLRLQNPGGFTASTCSASLADVPPRRLMAPSARPEPQTTRTKMYRIAFHFVV